MRSSGAWLRESWSIRDARSSGCTRVAALTWYSVSVNDTLRSSDLTVVVASVALVLVLSVLRTTWNMFSAVTSTSMMLPSGETRKQSCLPLQWNSYP